MVLPDVNVLVYAHRTDVSENHRYQRWLTELVESDAAFGLSDIVLSSFIRFTTHPRIYSPPSPLGDALQFIAGLRERPNYVAIAPGPRHWDIFTSLCQRVGAKGNAVPDAYLAALAIESGSEWVTTDRGFARFPGLRWRHPLD